MASEVSIGAADGSDDGRGHVALVTGASSGIGASFATLLAVKGYRVVLVARREDRLQALAAELRSAWGTDAVVLPADLSDPAAPAAIADAVAALGLRIDFLVNNAGASGPARFDQVAWPDHLARLRVMGLATLELTHRLLPGMLEGGWGRVVNVGSISGLCQGAPSEVLYTSAKAMVHMFSEGLDADLRSEGIRCTVSIPGFTDTEILDSSGLRAQVATSRAMRMALMSPQRVAREAYAAVMRGNPSIVHGRHHQALGLVLLHAPLGLRRRFAHRITRRATGVSGHA
jgi:short-subunit dehydrogenase